MNQEKTNGLVLRRTNYGEADRIVQFITPLGRRSAMARGVRKTRSKLAGGIELLSESEIVLRRGKGNLDTLSSARMKRFFKNILSDYDRMTFAYDVLRLVAKGSEQVDEPEWYDLVIESMEGLDATSTPLVLVKAWFYINYARLGGYELSLYRDINGEKIEQDAQYRYDEAERGLQRLSNGEITTEHIKILRLLSAKKLAIVAQVSGLQPFLAEALRAARQHAAVD